MQTVSVLFCCLGNICRSPTAHSVFEHVVRQRGFADRIRIDSAGTGDWHVGRPPDARSAHAAASRGYALDHLRARQVGPADFDHFDIILAMDRENLRHLQTLRPGHYRGELALFLSYHPDSPVDEVPDPYYGGEDGFAQVLDLVEAAAEGLLATLVTRFDLRSRER